MFESKLAKSQTLRNVCQNYFGVVLNHLPDENLLCLELLEDVLMELYVFIATVQCPCSWDGASGQPGH